MNAELFIAPCTRAAAQFAVSHWHYSKTLSSAKNVYFGVWEQGRFIGSIIFGIGSGNTTNGERFGLSRNGDMAELTRVALSQHSAPVSRIISIAITLLRRHSPGLRLLISMADPAQGHFGGIYQAGNWIYTGQTRPDVMYFHKGKWRHHRTVTSACSAKGLPSRPVPPKHRYLFPLDSEMGLKIESFRKPYPKRATRATESVQDLGGGSTPTRPLQIANG